MPGERYVDGRFTAEVRADPDDVEAALLVAAGRQAIALEGRELGKVDDRVRWTFRLRAPNGATGWFVASWKDEPTPVEGDVFDRSRLLELSARLSHFGDRDAEEQLIRQTARRLEQLRGVGSAPITP